MLAHSISGALKEVPFGRTKLYELIRQKRLIARKVDGRTIITDEDLRNCINNFPIISFNDKTEGAE